MALARLKRVGGDEKGQGGKQERERSEDLHLTEKV
jgi:hypothetical protein